MHPSDVNSVSSADNSRPSKWSWKTRAMAIILLVCLAVTAAFVGGFFAGRNNSSMATPIDVTMQHMQTTPLSKNWKEAVCSITESQCPPSFKKNPLILLSMDGFAAEYLKLRLTPSIEHLMSCGAHPPYMNPVFPTKTFPNHYSIATGLFPASHGIVDNTMYDPVLNKFFSIRSNEATKAEWWGGEPIWMTAKRQGVKTATYFWPGSDVPGQKADYYMPYNKSAPFDHRIRQLFRWLDKPEKDRPDFMTLYLEEPDKSGHKYGPQSENVKEALKKVDFYIDLLMDGLYLRNLIGCVNLLIVSDHGMEAISCDRVIALHQMNPNFDKTGLFSKDGTVGRLRPLVNSSDILLTELQHQFQCKSPHTWIYQQNEFPVRWRYEGNRRIDPLLFDVEPQWLTTDKYIRSESINPKDCSGGDHGYDNMDEDMWSIFIAIGPAFKPNVLMEPFLNIQIYNLMSVLLGVQPSPNNGTFGALFHILKTPPPYPHDTSLIELFVCNHNHTDYSNSSGCLTTATLKEDLSDLNVHQLAPWGFPLDTNAEANRKICLLANPNYLIGYSEKKRSPIWAIYDISPEVKIDYVFDVSAKELPYTSKYRMNDPRIPNATAPSCDLDLEEDTKWSEVIQLPLAFTEMSTKSEMHLVTNTVPVYKGFYYDVLKPLWAKVETWRLHFPYINVVSGPAWNKNETSSAEFSLPSYFYFLFTICGKSAASGFNCSDDQLDVLGFVLPHLNSLPPCWDPYKFLEKHQASVDVIELVTGLKFFVDMPQEVSLRLRLRLFQTSHLSISSETKSRRI